MSNSLDTFNRNSSYSGRIAIVKRDNLLYVETQKNIAKAIDTASKECKSNNNSEWDSLRLILSETNTKLIQAQESCSCRLQIFRLEILNDALLPYIDSMKSRMVLDKNRFNQIRKLLTIISPEEEISNQHISLSLRDIDKLIREINGSGGWFKSEFGSLLERASDKQWGPIVNGIRNTLFSIGGLLIFRLFIIILTTTNNNNSKYDYI